MNLRAALNDFSSGWRDDLSPSWRALLAGVSPDPLAVASVLTFDLSQPIYPGRRQSPLPGARPDAHVFRAFDSIEPSQVRCVLIGQDPYPMLSRATGRSFEQGDITTWSKPASSVASSLRVLVRMLIAARTQNDDVLKMSWAAVVALAASPGVSLESPPELFDRLQQTEGVLFLNAGLTLTRYRSGGAPEQTKGHIPFWRPVVGQTLRSLATRNSGQVVFLCLGQFAQKLLTSERVKLEASAAGTWGVRAAEVSLPHPVAPGFLGGANPFRAVNAQLASLGALPIRW
jgi:uracil-DNA glycosylase